MKFKSSLFAMLLVLSMILAACGSNEEAGEEQTETEEPAETGEVLELYTTIFPLEDFANKIGGEYVNVTNLVPVGADAHTFEPTAREMINVAEGDAFIYNGAGLEGFVDALIETVEGEGVAIVQASEGIELIDYDDDHSAHSEEGHDDHGHEEEAHDDHAHEEQGHEEEAHDDHAHEEQGHEEEAHDDHAHEEQGHEEGAHDAHAHDQDPHVWLDPILSISLAESIKDTLIELMPEQEETFTANFEQLKADLEDIDTEFQAMVDAAEKDTFLVSHAGYGYWEERYGLKQVGITGLSPTNEPSQRQLQDIIEFANEYGVNYVMFEQNISTQVAEMVKDEVGAEPLYLHNLEALVEENVQNGEDYLSLMRKNIEALGTALQ
ncbi:metal ABC transporter solute-binding protein, Zn/Mn family [Halalkalibacter nanhaiisediminis]|uniref:Zinc transport system substrate-binding protein n=1 Tax=Halalkalibacter nanhaiisediminis TaxID=688079 RepID=A0A562QIQ2_9BACI|nr:zinc ABC transporter substrate-binding protein [Halalkalibacter nanhaiisediminis]TWI55926.1 zinc transport system substrate-binding protein [Halalkalibacter nanhaiisediminis]